MTTAKGRSLMYLRTASARPVENKSILLLKDEKLKLMNFCFWFLFRPVTDSLQHRETIQFKSVLRCCLYTKNNCKNFHFCPQREKQSLLLAQLVFLLFAGSSRSKTQLAELPDFFPSNLGESLPAGPSDWGQFARLVPPTSALPLFGDGDDFPSAFSTSLHVCLFGPPRWHSKRKACPLSNTRCPAEASLSKSESEAATGLMRSSWK